MKNNKYKVSIIIPNYNRKKDLERLLPSIANQTFNDYEVLIIDDCSPDRSAVEYVRSFVKDHKNMRLIENERNLGFVKTCNKGIRLSNSEYICILTNDTDITKNFVERNVAIMDADNSIGVLSCIVIDQSGNNWFSGGSIRAGFLVNLRDDFQGIRTVDFVAGTACFYRREVFDKIGLLNEYFYMYHEDIEFCLRVKSKTNYKVCMFSDKLLKHYVGTGTLAHKKLLYYGHRNHIVLLKKYAPEFIPRLLLHYLREIAHLIRVSVMKLRPSYFLSTRHIVRGIIDGLVKGETK